MSTSNFSKPEALALELILACQDLLTLQEKADLYAQTFLCVWFLDWRQESLINRPSVFQADINGIPFQPGFLAPCRKWLRSTVVCHETVETRIPALLRSRCPLAISWFIVSVIIDTLKAFTLWAFSHISKEILKCIPRFADSYPAINVVLVSVGFWISAPLAHSQPRQASRRKYFPGHLLNAIRKTN